VSDWIQVERNPGGIADHLGGVNLTYQDRSYIEVQWGNGSITEHVMRVADERVWWRRDRTYLFAFITIEHLGTNLHVRLGEVGVKIRKLPKEPLHG